MRMQKRVRDCGVGSFIGSQSHSKSVSSEMARARRNSGRNDEVRSAMSVAVSVLCRACRGVSASGARGRYQGGHRPVTTPGTQLNAICTEAKTHHKMTYSVLPTRIALETQRCFFQPSFHTFNAHKQLKPGRNNGEQAQVLLPRADYTNQKERKKE